MIENQEHFDKYFQNNILYISYLEEELKRTIIETQSNESNSFIYNEWTVNGFQICKLSD